MRNRRDFFEDRQAESGALCADVVLVLAHPILCAEFIFGSCVFMHTFINAVILSEVKQSRRI